ncbi:MAG: hypothetical protein JKY10_10745 [Cohaesibacteraceae bacterium]|nr:hypothetical protein [Cohaesibacteraceae bacterium]
MSIFKILAAAGLVALTTSTAFAGSGDLKLFGVNSTNVDAADNGGTSQGRTEPVMSTNDLAIFTQQVVGNAKVTATLELTSDSTASFIYSSNKDDGASTTVNETGNGGTAGTAATDEGNKISGYENISRSTTTNLLTIQNVATNATASFSADNLLAAQEFGGTERTAAGTVATGGTVDGRNFVAQQVLADAATLATLTIKDLVTLNTNTVNIATGASALINLRRK